MPLSLGQRLPLTLTSGKWTHKFRKMLMQIKRVNPEDYEDILALNESALPHVNSISRLTLEHLHRASRYFGVVHINGQIAGFLLALGEGANYKSMNYLWFDNHYSTFAYIDRIVIRADFRRMGLGQKLYADLEESVAGSSPMLTCEVNLRPPNPGSIVFHQQLGFAEVDQQETEQGAKRVSLMVKTL